jgi:phenylpropionate dioxygenase-like ring-hydroxylating dioxygenase large terminal subunit
MNPILPGAPWLVAHRSMLPVNQPCKISLNGKDYAVWRDREDRIAAIANICPHLQAPLSDGWIDEKHGTITCPFHTLEFDREGCLWQENAPKGKPLLDTLELIIVDDFIWTYGGFEPRLPIPELHQRIARKYDFVGVAGNKSIAGDFLTSLLINYDYNHQNGTHRELFHIQENSISNYEENGYYTKLVQSVVSERSTWQEILQNPGILMAEKAFDAHMEYAFPSTTVLEMQTATMDIAQVHLLYPETSDRTRTFVLCFAKFKNPILKPLLKGFFLKAVDTVVEQDTTAIEHSYPRSRSKIRLPKDDVMDYATSLYQNWS